MGEKAVKLLDNLQERRDFSRHLVKDVRALEKMLKDEVFESGVRRIGAEQELCLIDKAYRVAPIVMQMLDDLDPDHFTTEYATFNLEINLDPLPFKGKCLSKMHKQLEKLIKQAADAAAKSGSQVALAGILPTLKKSDLRVENLTPQPRYEALNKLIHQLRGRQYEFSIRGIDELVTRDNPTVFGGSVTSMQIHLQVDQQDAAPLYNWAQAISGPVLSCCVNSPLFLGKRLWHETRIAIFQQASDIRRKHNLKRDVNPRVQFGNNWIEESVLEVFKEDFSRYTLMMGTDIEQDSLEALEKGEVPKLTALSFQNGMIYRWNRICYGITKGKPHLRIENRLLPAGPSVVDEIANSALWLGLMYGMPKKYRNINKKMDFDVAKGNLLAAARHGINVQMKWVDGESVPADKLLLEELLPIARKGLQKAEVHKDDIDYYLGIIRDRVKSKQTGAEWMLDSYSKLIKESSNGEVMLAIMASMVKNQQGGKPVHEWPLADLASAGSVSRRYSRIDQLMRTDIVSVQEDDTVDLVANIMNWKDMGYIPVEDVTGKLQGLITKDSLLSFFAEHVGEGVDSLPVRDLMVNRLHTVPPETSIPDAVGLMAEKQVSCLPVVEQGRLLGLVTERDLITTSAQLFQELNNLEENHKNETS